MMMNNAAAATAHSFNEATPCYSHERHAGCCPDAVLRSASVLTQIHSSILSSSDSIPLGSTQLSSSHPTHLIHRIHCSHSHNYPFTNMAQPRPKEVSVRVEVIRLGRGDDPKLDEEEVTLDTTATSVDLTNLRATRLPDFSALGQLQVLTFRQNCLRVFNAVESHCPHVTQLDLFENMIGKEIEEEKKEGEEDGAAATMETGEGTSAQKSNDDAAASTASSSSSTAPPVPAPAVPAASAPSGLSQCVWPNSLVVLDLSHNHIHRIENINHLVHLRELFLVSNRIKHIENLEGLARLRALELGSNALRSIGDGLQPVARSLEELWLGRNKITSLAGVEMCTNLRKLSMQSNRLTEVGNSLEKCTKLEELYLSHNGLSGAPLGLHTLANLHTLDLASNRLTTLLGCGIESMTKLQELWLNHNAIEDWSQIEPIFIARASSLRTIYLEGNPVQKQQSAAEYVARVKKCVPKLEQLDADYL